MPVLLLACGNPQATTPDAGEDAIFPVADARPREYADIVWERVVPLDGDPRVYNAVVTSEGVAVVTEPELVLYGTNGDDLARGPWPTPSTPSLGWRSEVSAPYREGLASLFGAVTDKMVRQYGSGLAAGPSSPISASTLGALGVTGERIFALTAIYELELHEIGHEGLIASHTLAEGRYETQGTAIATDDGALLFCLEDFEEQDYDIVKLARVDLVDLALTSINLSKNGALISAGECTITRGSTSILAVWRVYGPTGYRWSLISLDGRTILVDYVHGDELYGTIIGTAFDGRDFVVLAYHGSPGVSLYFIDPHSGELLRELWVRAEYGEVFGNDSAAMTSDGQNIYVAIAPEYPMGPRTLRIQKLAPVVINHKHPPWE